MTGSLSSTNLKVVPGAPSKVTSGTVESEVAATNAKRCIDVQSERPANPGFGKLLHAHGNVRWAEGRGLCSALLS
jgi:hypothetical protein